MSRIIRSRFSKALDTNIESFVQCIDDDKHLAMEDISGSIAHVKMLQKQKLVTDEIANRILAGLSAVKNKFSSNHIQLDPTLEDIHMNIEHMLKEQIGQDADYLHTARSRNDQVALDITLHTVNAAKTSAKKLAQLNKSIAACALKNFKAVMPSYTHLQRAQPVLLAHVLASFISAHQRDIQKFESTIKNAASPLGAGALTGSSLGIDPKSSAKYSGLNNVFTNSIDAVTNRDIICDYVYASALTAVHLSQIAESLIIWSSSEFQFVILPDEICTSSSIMPQKRNADSLELVRSKAAVLNGQLSALLGILKGLHVGYNRDLQDTKPILFHTEKIINQSIDVIKIAFDKIKFNKKAAEAACDQTIFATDVVEAMVKKGVAFREAHKITAKAIKQNKYKQLAKKYGVTFNPYKSVSLKCSHGSTSPKEVKKYLVRITGK